MDAVKIIPIVGVPLVQPGDDVGQLLIDALRAQDTALAPGDVVVVCQKVISKAEGAVVHLADVTPSPFAAALAETSAKDARLVEVILRESRRIVRMDRGHLICETGPGWICANAGVDASNSLGEDTVILLPRDPDASAERLRAGLARASRVDVGVLITDTFGRPWREGLTEVALGVAGFDPFLDFRGHHDLDGRELRHTVLALADDLACAAGLVMLKDRAIPAAVVRGAPIRLGAGDARRLIRRAEFDLFR